MPAGNVRAHRLHASGRSCRQMRRKLEDWLLTSAGETGRTANISAQADRRSAVPGITAAPGACPSVIGPGDEPCPDCSFPSARGWPLLVNGYTSGNGSAGISGVADGMYGIVAIRSAGRVSPQRTCRRRQSCVSDQCYSSSGWSSVLSPAASAITTAVLTRTAPRRARSS
jgi:hypothetical protein